ncbi:hypothetical protein ACFW6S_28745 [Streptomyces sp. NPDC058740]|uniref:hypothetical protein n=1 Tax=Streptomyces sp. NPDC058740 TaxID=3346619 RepID=UPI0036812062
MEVNRQGTACTRRARPGRGEGLSPLGRGESMSAGFDELFERLNRFLASAAPAGAWAPPADMHETDDTHVVEVEVPGIRDEDIDGEIGDREPSVTEE